jgi:hypothetical protein
MAPPRGRGYLGREPINPERQADIRFGAHSGLKVGCYGTSEKRQQETHAALQTAFYSITSSASRRNDSSIFNPSALAVFKLITSWNLVG